MNSNTESNKDQGACEYQENVDMLRQIDFFSCLPLEATKVFAYLCTRETFKAGDYLFQQGDEDDRAFYLISGDAQLEHKSEKTEGAVRTYTPGEFVGRLTLVGKMRRLFSLKAQTDVTCLVLDREKFSKALEQFPDVMPKIIRVLVDNIYNWDKRFLAGHTADCRDCLQQIGVSLV